MFRAKVDISAEALMQCPPAYERGIVHVKAVNKGFHYRSDEEIPLKACVTEAAAGFHEDYQRLKDTRAGIDGSFFYDIDQSASFGNCSALVPCLVSHGTIVNGRTSRTRPNRHVTSLFM